MGMFDPDLNPAAWFDESLMPEGWFDSNLIPLPTLRTMLVAFAVVQPDYAHPPHHHDDLVIVGTEVSLVLTAVAVAVIRRLRATAQD